MEAYRRADELFPDHERSAEDTELFALSFQDALMRWVIARGTCDPNDVTKPWDGWSAAPEDMARDEAVVTDHGAQLIFDRWEVMRIQANIGLVPATAEDLETLPRLLLRLPALSAESRTRALRALRLLRFVIEELATAPEAPGEKVLRDISESFRGARTEELVVPPGGV